MNFVSDEHSVTALSLACMRGDIEMVENLLAHGANLNIGGKEGITPLIKAVEYGQLEIVQLLLHNGKPFILNYGK